MAKLDDRIAGASIGFLKPFQAQMDYFIDDFFVCPKHQRQGIWAAFIMGIKRTMKENGTSSIVLSTQKDYLAHKFYESVGFKAYGEPVILVADF